MMVPMAKQKQHDELQAAADEYQSLTSKRLSQDNDAVTAKLDELRGRADEISTGLLEGGVNSDLINKFRKLKRDKDKEFSQEGLVGNAAMNYDTATKFVNDLATEKERQAGWSPARAKAWAQAQVANFQGTANADGTFNTFAGRELAQKYDLQEFMEDAIDNVAEQVSPIGLQVIKVGGLPAFQQAFQSGKVSRKDYNTIMESMVIQAQNNPDLLASLNQEAFWTNEKTPTDFGRFEIVKDQNGRDVRKWQVGNSFAGRRMAGMALGARYNNVDLNYKFLKDDLGLMMYERGLDEQKAVSLINFTHGEMNQIDRSNLDDIKNSVDMAGQELQRAKMELDALKKNPNANPRQIERLERSYRDAKINYSNDQARLDSIYKNVDMTSLNDSDRKVLGVIEAVEQYGSAQAAAESMGINLPSPGRKATISGFNEENWYRMRLAERMGVDLNQYTGTGNNMGWYNLTGSVRNKRNKGAKEYLEANPQAEYFTRFNAESTGKFATEIGRANKLQTDIANRTQGQGMTLAYGKGRFEDLDLENLIGPSNKGYNFAVELTDGWDSQGNKFNNVIISNPETNEVTSIQVIDNTNPTTYMMAAKQMAGGSYAHQKYAEDLMAGFNYMPEIKRSNLAFQDKGTIGAVPLSTRDGEPVQVNWRKVEDASGTYYLADVNGEPLNGGNSIQGEKEMALAIDRFVKSKMPKE